MQVYARRCALCHGADGQGQASGGKTVFPPLWGPKSFIWGAGMHELQNAAGFMKENMPLGLGGSLTDQQAWDVALFMDSHERPQDPRFAARLPTRPIGSGMRFTHPLHRSVAIATLR
ncbi:hypothetical protein GCM10027419_30060 [Pandoraea terrae]